MGEKQCGYQEMGSGKKEERVICLDRNADVGIDIDMKNERVKESE